MSFTAGLYHTFPTVRETDEECVAVVSEVEESFISLEVSTKQSDGHVDEIVLDRSEAPEEAKTINAAFEVTYVGDNTVSLEYNAELTEQFQNEVEAIMEQWQEEAVPMEEWADDHSDL